MLKFLRKYMNACDYYFSRPRREKYFFACAILFLSISETIFAAPFDNSSNSQIALDDAGNTVAVWQEIEGSNFVVRAAILLSGDAWGPSEIISSQQGDALYPQVAINHEGKIMVVWQHFIGSHFAIKSARATIGQPWQPDEIIAEGSEDLFFPQIGMDSQGNCLVVWLKAQQKTSGLIMSANFSSASETWGVPVVLGDCGSSISPARLAVNANGILVAVWQNERGKDVVIQARRGMINGVWDEIATISPSGQSSFDAQIAINIEGQAIAVWENGIRNHIDVQASYFPDLSGNWSPPIFVTPDDVNAIEGKVVLNDSGNGAVIWNSNASSIQSSRFSFSSLLWTAPNTLSLPSQNYSSPQLAGDNMGNLLAIWQASVEDSTNIEAALFSPVMEMWGFPQTISDSNGGELPVLKLNQTGDAVASWTTQLNAGVETALFTMGRGWFSFGPPAP